MKRILVPTDFSPISENAIKVACKIAKKMDAEIYLLHVLDIPHYESNSGFNVESNFPEGIFMMKLAQKKFKELVAKPFLKGVKVIEAIQFDATYDNILKQADTHNVDLIVIGSAGTSGFGERFVGSTTEKIVRLANCPVLTIKEETDDFNPKNIVFASNFFKEVASVFSKIKNIADLYEAKLHLLKVITPNQFEDSIKSKKAMEDFANQFDLTDYTVNVFNDYDIESGILNFAADTNADMVSTTTHGRRGIAHFFAGGSIAENVVNHAKRPILTMKTDDVKLEYGHIFPEIK